MKNDNYDYKKDDCIFVSIKTPLFKEVLNAYKNFGWRVVLVEEDKKYSDVVNVQLLRRHDIENKDKLQLMQVYLEKSINTLGTLSKNKNVKSTLLAILSGFIGCVLIAVGLVLALVYTNVTNIVLGSATVVAGLSVIVVYIIKMKKMIKREEERYKIRIANVLSSITKLRNQAAALWEDENAGA